MANPVVKAAIVPLRHIVRTREIDREWIEGELFPLCDRLRRRVRLGEPLKGRSLFCLFYEPSLLTRTSFERAMGLLGGHVQHTEDASQFFPVRAPTYIENTVRLLASLHFDAIVLRSGQAGVVERAAAADAVPVINGGSTDDHPTQALLDLYTLRQELGRLDGITVGVVGRTEHRNVNALLFGLAAFREVQVVLVPVSGQVQEDVVAYVSSKGVGVRVEKDLRALEGVDAVYLNSPNTAAHAELLRSHNLMNLKIDEQFLARLKPTCPILDPMQRTGDFLVETGDPRLAYYRQAENGLYIRMALLSLMLAPRVPRG
ncbi:MAG: hypothetical protein HY535_04055 [Chloroflexi bacterium]|nr:hypothetical protein [Chloroflexota bacterium]